MFTDFSKAVHARYEAMSRGELFVTDVADIFQTYLAAFPVGSNPIFRERTVHDCNCCKTFIRKLGVLVAIKPDGSVESVWDDLNVPAPYDEVARRLSDIVRQAPILTVFRSKERQYSTPHNYDGKTDQRYDHFFGKVGPKHYSNDAATLRGEREAIFQVLKRGLTELRASDVADVLELIDSNALYRGGEHRASVVEFQKLQSKFDGTDKFVWSHLDSPAARFRNTVIGTLLVDLAEGGDLEQAVRSFETKVAPQNYKRPTALITQKMVDGAIDTLRELELGGAIQRRFAKLSDVSVNNVLFVDNAVAKQMKDSDGIAALLSDAVKPATINVKNATKISADNFEREVLPAAKEISVLVENKHAGNFVSLTCGDGPERLFKWNNNFAWSYDGEVADSIKQRVKKAGGNVNALLRVSLGWFNYDDLDIHMQTPHGAHIYFGNKLGVLDVDMNIGGGGSREAVENLAIQSLESGTYRFWVNQFTKRENKDLGFTIEMEYAGAIHQWSYTRAVVGNVECLEIHVESGRVAWVKANEALIGGAVSTEKWGVKTETLVPVHVLLNSPNHWDGQHVGNKHWFFMLKGCRNPEPTRGIYNEFLRGDLDKHRKVFEILGSKTKCPVTEDQISGVGFSSARGDAVTVVVNGKRAYEVTF